MGAIRRFHGKWTWTSFFKSHALPFLGSNIKSSNIRPSNFVVYMLLAVIRVSGGVFDDYAFFPKFYGKKW